MARFDARTLSFEQCSKLDSNYNMSLNIKYEIVKAFHFVFEKI